MNELNGKSEMSRISGRSRMKICFLYHNLEKFGGAENNLVNLMLEIKRIGNEVDFYTFGISDYYKNLLNGKVNIKIIKAPKILTKQPFVWLYIKLFNLLGKNEFLEDYDAINIHAYPMHWMAEGIHKKVVWNCNEPPMTYFPLKGKTNFEKSLRNFVKRIFYDTLEIGMVKNHIDKIVVLDKGMQTLIKRLYGISAKVVRIGVNTDLYRPKGKKDYIKMKILFVSRLDKHKRVEDFLKALELLQENSSVKDFEVYVIGSGPQEPLLNEFMKQLPFKITHLKNVSDEKVVDIYNKGNVLVFPAVSQPWGLVPFEAMACKCAVIVSKDTGAAEVLTHMKNSILIDPYEPQQIAKWIEYLMINKKVLKRLSEDGFSFVTKNITLERYAEHILEELQS